MCVCVFSCVGWAICVLVVLNIFVRIVWYVLCDDVWFVLVFVFACCA